MPSPGRVVKRLLLINLAVFIAQLLVQGAFQLNLGDYLGLTTAAFWQVWRYLTFQFLHSTQSLWHLGLNMLGLYMLGTPLEQHWGPRRFLAFYLTCGAGAGIAYVVMGWLRHTGEVPIIGASGGVYGIVLACAVFFPHFRLVLFLFPVPIRMAAVIIFGGMVLVVMSSLRAGRPGPQFWSDVAHLGGAGMAAIWIWVLPRLRGTGQRLALRRGQGAWQRRVRRQADEDAEIDRILRKIRDSGIASLSDREKRTLQEATRRRQSGIPGENDL